MPGNMLGIFHQWLEPEQLCITFIVEQMREVDSEKKTMLVGASK